MHAAKTKERLITVIAELTGIPEKTIQRYGILNVFQTPWTVKGMSLERKERIDALQDFVSLWNELTYVQEETFLDSSQKAGEFFKNRLGHKRDKEYFEIAYVNVQNRVVAIETHEGTLSYCLVYPREIIKNILAYNAAGIFLAHCHPSGSSKPSNNDIEVTNRIKAATKTIETRVYDHIIVTDKDYFSFGDNGLM